MQYVHYQPVFLIYRPNMKKGVTDFEYIASNSNHTLLHPGYNQGQIGFHTRKVSLCPTSCLFNKPARSKIRARASCFINDSPGDVIRGRHRQPSSVQLYDQFFVQLWVHRKNKFSQGSNFARPPGSGKKKEERKKEK